METNTSEKGQDYKITKKYIFPFVFLRSVPLKKKPPVCIIFRIANHTVVLPLLRSFQYFNIIWATHHPDISWIYFLTYYENFHLAVWIWCLTFRISLKWNFDISVIIKIWSNFHSAKTCILFFCDPIMLLGLCSAPSQPYLRGRPYKLYIRISD